MRGEHRGYQVKEDRYYVFLNYEKLGEFLVREQAVALVKKLVSEAPVRDFQEYLQTLLEAL